MKGHTFTTWRGNPGSEKEARDYTEQSATGNIPWFWCQTLARQRAGQVVSPSQSDSNTAAGAMLSKLSDPDIND